MDSGLPRERADSRSSKNDVTKIHRMKTANTVTLNAEEHMAYLLAVTRTAKAAVAVKLLKIEGTCTKSN